MLDKIRENSRSIGTYIIFGVLIVVFVAYFGPGSSGCVGMGDGSATAPAFAARVNGETVSMRAFREQYDRMYRMYGSRMGGNLTPEMAEQLHLKDTVLDNLVSQQLVLQAARKTGLAVSDAELAEELKKIPSFQKEGHFDFDTYQQTLQAMGTTSDAFEASVREDLLRQRFLAQLRQAAVVTDEQVKEKFEQDSDRAKLAYARIPVAQYAKPSEIPPAEIDAYLATADGKAAMEAEYERAKTFRFEKPRRVAAQHILIKVEEDAPQADVDAAKEKLLAAKKRVEGGEDFGKVAGEVSEDPSTKVKGGDLGLFGPGTMVKPFEEAAMALQPGQISDAVRSRFGWHLIKVNDVKAAETTPKEEAVRTLASEALAKKKADQMAVAEGEKALAAARASGKLLTELYPKPEDPTQKPEGAFGGETSFFQARSQYIPSIGVAPEITADLAKVTEKGVLLPRAYMVSGDVFIAQVIDRQLPDPAELEKRKDAIRDELARDEEQRLVDSVTKQLKASALIERNPAIAGDEGTAPAEG